MLVSHTTHIVCAYFIHEWRDLHFKVDSERQISFEKLFMAILFSRVSQDYVLIFHTTHIVCANFIYEWRDLHFKIDSERQISFEKLFMAILVSLVEVAE